MNKKFTTLASVIAVGMLASTAFAAPVISDVAGAGSYSKRFIAYEVYNNNIGINADNVPLFIKTGAPNTTGGAINLQITNGKVNEGAGQLFISATGAAITGAVCANPIVPATYYLIAESAAQGVVTPVTTTMYDNATFCLRNGLAAPAPAVPAAGNITIPAGSTISTQHGSVDTVSKLAVTTVKQAINLSVNSLLGPTCTVQPLVSVAYVTNQETAGPTDVLQIIPQIVGSTNVQAFTGSLDSDQSFQKFLTHKNNLNIAKTSFTTAIGSGFVLNFPTITLIDQQTQGINGLGATSLFDAFVAPSAVTSMTLGFTSAAPEAGVTVNYRGGNLTHTGNVWSTSVPDVDTLGNITNGISRPLIVTNDPTKEMNPTAWSLSNFALSVNNFPTCVTFANPVVGVWTGGLEAYVPFVKTTAGYETFIKLANRYTKDAVVFVASLSGSKANTSSVVTSTTQLNVPGVFTTDLTKIPANGGQITITGADLLANNVVSSADLAAGVAVKFLLRVPTQQDFDGVQSNSIADPYVTGVVVSTTPSGQRAINLNFKLTRNGSLVGN
jgi:hypothetical protein